MKTARYLLARDDNCELSSAILSDLNFIFKSRVELFLALFDIAV